LHAAGIPVRRCGELASSWPPWTASANAGAKPVTTRGGDHRVREAKPAITEQVITNSAVQKVGHALTARVCEPYRELIEYEFLRRLKASEHQPRTPSGASATLRRKLCGTFETRVVIGPARQD
jgi:hypothetical protein